MNNNILVISQEIKSIKKRFLHSKEELEYGHKCLSEKQKNELKSTLEKEMIFADSYSVANELITQRYYTKNENGGFEANNNKIKQFPLVAIVEETGLENENEWFDSILSSYGIAPDKKQFQLSMFKKHFSKNLCNDFQGRMYLVENLNPFGNIDKYYISPYTTHTTKTFKNHEIICTSVEFETQADSPMNKLYAKLTEKYFKK